VISQEEDDRAKQLQSPLLQPQEAAGEDFRFVRNPDLRKIIERDHAELLEVNAINAIKSQYVLCGGLIEALLLDALQGVQAKATEAAKAPKRRDSGRSKPLNEWNLAELIDVAMELRIIGTGTERFGQGVRNYRNLIHPGREIQSEQQVALQEATISVNVLEIVIRELRQRSVGQ
jgi:hypothetical protein